MVSFDISFADRAGRQLSSWLLACGQAILVSMALWLVLFVGSARADWINLTGAETAHNIAEITVLDDRVRIGLEIYIGNLATFEELLPDKLLRKTAVNRPSLTERMKLFSAKTFQVVASNDAQLQGELKLAEPRLRKDRASPFAGKINPVTRRRLPGAPKDKRVLYVELEYPFSGKPESLTFIPPLDGKNTAKVSIGFIAYHKAVPIIDFRYLSGPAKVNLDWADPWYSKFENRNLKRHHKSAMMSFLYVEPREVRHEALVRVRDLQGWTDLGLGGAEIIPARAQAQIKARAAAFFETRNPLQIDGTLVKPVSSRAEFLKISLSGLKVIETDQPLELSTAILGVILNYPVTSLPNHVNVDWELFNQRVQRLPATSIDPTGPLSTFIDASDPTHEWRNYLLKYKEPRVSPIVADAGRHVPIPAVSAVLAALALVAMVFAFKPVVFSRRMFAALAVLSAGLALSTTQVGAINVRNPLAGPPLEKVASKILSGILTNATYALMETREPEVRRSLALITAPERIDDVEKELRRALVVKIVGGGKARVRAIENMAVREIFALAAGNGFRTTAEWTAKASGGHWGHTHRRTIHYRAVVEVIQADGIWKISGITVVDANPLGKG